MSDHRDELLHGYVAIAAALNITKRQAQHWVRIGLIPIFHSSLLAAMKRREREASNG